MVKTSPGTGSRFFGPGGQTARLMLYGLAAVVLMAMDQRGHYVSSIRSAAGTLVEPIYHAVEWPLRAVRNLSEQFQSRRSLRQDNDRLRGYILLQQAALQRLETLTQENRRLRSLFEGASGQEFEYRFAELLRVDLDPFSHKVLIDRGSVDGVTRGQAVIDGDGVMGQVEDVQLHFSTVRLISDPNHALPVQISRTGLRTVAFGMGTTGHLSLTTVPREADVREGDLLVTSGLGDRFPGGYPVARITRINRGEGLSFAQLEAEPLAALDRGREVLLISALPVDEKPAEPATGAPKGASQDEKVDDAEGQEDVPDAPTEENSIARDGGGEEPE